MITKTTLLDKFMTVVPHRNCEFIRKKLLRICGKTDLDAAKRAYDIFFKSELEPLVLKGWEPITATNFENTYNLEYIVAQIKPVEDAVFPAINELKKFIPLETRQLLKTMFSRQDPRGRVAVMIFTVALATLEDVLT